jgi:hypothetical protein
LKITKPIHLFVYIHDGCGQPAAAFLCDSISTRGLTFLPGTAFPPSRKQTFAQGKIIAVIKENCPCA